MIQLKNAAQIKEMMAACRITGESLLVAREHVKPGISTYDLDKIIREYIERRGAKPTFLGYGGFPAAACISVNDEIIHGIPSKNRILEEGDIVKVDVGAYYRGYTGDSARTIPVGRISPEAEQLIRETRNSFFRGLEQLKPGGRMGDIGEAIDGHIRQFGYSTVKCFVGHGVGHTLHEDPEVPNFGKAGRGVRLCAGMTLAIEPMVNIGSQEVIQLDNGWTVKTADGSLSSHYENSVALTSDGVINMTLIEADF